MILKCKHQIQVYSLKPYWFQIKILPLLTLKWHILTDDHSYTMLLGDTRIWTFQTFSLFLESLVKTKKKCHFLLTPVVPKRQNKLLLIWRRSQKSAVFHFFKHLKKNNYTWTNILMLFKLPNDQNLIHLKEKGVHLLIW